MPENAKMNPSEMIFLRTKSAELFKIYLKMQSFIELPYGRNTMQNSHEYHRLEETDYSSLKFLKQWEVGQTDFRTYAKIPE